MLTFISYAGVFLGGVFIGATAITVVAVVFGKKRDEFGDPV